MAHGKGIGKRPERQAHRHRCKGIRTSAYEQGVYGQGHRDKGIGVRAYEQGYIYGQGHRNKEKGHRARPYKQGHRGKGMGMGLVP